MRTDVVFPRILAYIVDLIIFIVVWVALLLVLDAAGLANGFEFDWEGDGDDSSNFGNTWLWLSALAELIYKAGQEGRWGQTIGKRVVDISVVKAGTYGRIGWVDAIIRNLFLVVPLTLAAITENTVVAFIGIAWLLIGAISMIESSENQRLGDRAAKTVVVRSS